MILAINVNAAIDWVYFIDRFIPNSDMRVKKAVLSVGGKGLDAALVLKTLDAPVKALTFAAGHNGKTLENLLLERQVDCEILWVPGETRVSNVIVETDFNHHSHVTAPGYSLTRDDCDAFLAKISSLAEGVQWALMAGSLPQGAPVGFYGEIIALLHRHGIKALIDNTAAPMLEALKSFPEVAKMNQAEFQATFGVKVNQANEWIETCRGVMKQYQMQSLVVTRGKRGILALTPEGVFEAICQQEVHEVNAAGAGDAVSGTLAYRLSLGDGWPRALAWAVAASAAVVKTEGTAECYLPDILDLYPQVLVNRLEL